MVYKMNGLLIYFSGTGNTKYIAQCIKNEFINEKDTITMYSIEEHFKINPSEYNFLILGSPKFYEYTPKFFMKWIKENLPAAQIPMETIVFCTGCAPTKTSFKDIEKILFKKKYIVVMTKTFQMPNNYLIGKYRGTPKEKYSQYYKNSKEKAINLVNNFKNNIYSKETIGFIISGLFKNISYLCSSKTSSKAKNFSVNLNCTSCGLCEQCCPTQNIKIIDGKITFGDKCIFCTRCVNSCPTNAILYNNKIPEQYLFNKK